MTIRTPHRSRSTVPRQCCGGSARITSSTAIPTPAMPSSTPNAPRFGPNRPPTAGARSSPSCANISPHKRFQTKWRRQKRVPRLFQRIQLREKTMCSYIIEKTAVSGSAKGPNGWMRIDTANVYFDHPYHAPLDHALAIDFVCEADGAKERVAVELSAESARALVKNILAALARVEAAHAR